MVPRFLKGLLPSRVVQLSTASSARLVFQNARIIDGTGAPAVNDGSMVVERGRVTYVGSSAQIQVHQDQQVIDLEGRTIIPGMVEAHVHLRGEMTHEPYRRYLYPSHETRLLRAVVHALELLHMGFTTIRDIGNGFGLQIREASNLGLIVAPRILAAVRAISCTNGHGDWHPFPYELVRLLEPRALLANGIDECRKAVRHCVSAGADLVKVFASAGGVTNTPEDVIQRPNFTRDELHVMVTEARRNGLMSAAHANGADAVRNALLSGFDTIEHGRFDYEAHQDVVDLMAEKRDDFIMVPTPALYVWVQRFGREWGIFGGGIASAQSALEQSISAIAAAKQLGIKMAVGTDDMGLVEVRENAVALELLVEAGLSPMQAIVAATSHGAEAVGLHDRIGSLKPGKLAEFVVLRRDPLEDIRCLQDPEVIETVYCVAVN